MMLNNKQIRQCLHDGHLQVSPDEGLDLRLQPASLDVRLGTVFARQSHLNLDVIDTKADTTGRWQMYDVGAEGYFDIPPGEHVLACTMEKIALPNFLAGRVEGKSSLGRIGLVVHQTAGFIDPGWELATITLELSCVAGRAIRVYPGAPIAQIAFEEVQPVVAGYSGKYVGQSGPTPSQYHRNWTGTCWA
jgi:dCTP deaminase